MSEIETILDQMQITRADHLPVIAAFCRRIELIETINRMVPNEMEVSVGLIVQGMILDTLSGPVLFIGLPTFFNIRIRNYFWEKK